MLRITRHLARWIAWQTADNQQKATFDWRETRKRETDRCKARFK